MTQPGLSIQLLGTMALSLGDQTLPPPLARKARALLAYLVLEGRPVARDRLCALLWPSATREKARLSLRVALSQLRPLVPDRLRAEADRLSFAALEGDVVDVLALLQSSSESADAASLARAAALHRGPLLNGLSSLDSPEFDAWLSVWREQLDERLRGVLLRLAQLAVASGGDEALGHLRRASAIDPLHEPTEAALMLALARSGEHTAALARFARLQASLAETFGVEPSVELLAIRERILTARARGAQASLPMPPTSFVGRETEIAVVLELLADPACGPVSIVGPGGIGKTRLAIEVAGRLVKRYLDGVRFVALAGLAPGDSIAPSLAAELSLQLVGAATPLEQVKEALRDREVLLLLDNFETIAGQADEAAQLLAAGPNVRILITSRTPLGLPLERILHVDGLSYPDAGGEPSRPERHGAVALFVAAARRVLPDFAAEPELEAIGAICRQVQGFPLALELAAPWVVERHCDAIAARLAIDLGALPGIRGLPARHASLEAVFEHAWSFISGAERIAFARLCVFRGGFDALAAEAAVAVSRELLATLVRRSLVSHAGGERYMIHEVLRHFGALRLDQTLLLADRVRDAHARCYLERFAAVVVQHGAADRAVVAMVEADSENLQTAWRHAVARRDYSSFAPAAVDLAAYYYAQGPSPFGVALCDDVVACFDEASADDAPPILVALSARLMAERGFFELRAGDRERAGSAAERALALAEAHRPRIGSAADEAIAVALRLRGILRRDAGDMDAASEALDAAVRHAQRAGSEQLAAEAAYHRAGIAVYRGDLADCIDGTREVLKEIQGRGFQRLECAIHYTLAVVQDRAGAIEAGTASSRACLALASVLGYRLGEMNATATVGVILYRRGQLAEALEHLERSVRLALDLGHRATENTARLLASTALVDMGRSAEASFHLERVLDQTRADGATRTEAGARLRLAYLQRANHDHVAAAASAELALATFQSLGDGAHTAMARAEIGRCIGRRGDVELARHTLDEAIDALRAVGERTQWLTTRLDRARLDAAGVTAEERLREATAVRDKASASGVDALVAAAEVLRGRLLAASDPQAAQVALSWALERYTATGLPHRAVDAASALARCWLRDGRAEPARQLVEGHLDAVFRHRLVGLESPRETLEDLRAVLEGTNSARAGELTTWAARWPDVSAQTKDSPHLPNTTAD
ncbi:MAG: tetratricopeptide repeat protein [Ardenticatenia bacterium]|nr:tetratricopeptide repeat protein [Ardenticatenia bacterium]